LQRWRGRRRPDEQPRCCRKASHSRQAGPRRLEAALRPRHHLRLPGAPADRATRALSALNEGYHGASPEAAVRAELCREAMRLTAMLLDHPRGRAPATRALAALMALNAARLPARLDAS